MATTTIKTTFRGNFEQTIAVRKEKHGKEVLIGAVTKWGPGFNKKRPAHFATAH